MTSNGYERIPTRLSRGAQTHGWYPSSMYMGQRMALVVGAAGPVSGWWL
jgi:hypothetical protein